MKKRFIIQLLIISFFCFGLSSGFCQDTSSVKQTEDEFIKWIKQYPEVETEKKKSNLFVKTTNVILGKKDIPLMKKPMVVLASNPDSIIVLDQGSGAIFQILNSQIEIPKSLRKKFTGFNSLVGICQASDKNILFTDSRLNKIYLITADKKELRILNDSLSLQQPTGIAYSKINNQVWVVETAAHRISILDNNGNLIKTIGSRGTGKGEFNFPTYICIDKSGDAYIVDAMNFRIQIFNKNGEYVSSFGSLGDATGNLARPKGIATDSFGNIYIADAIFHTVQIFDKSGQFLYNFGTQGSTKEKFWMPTGVFIDSKNYIYVADTYNSRVQIFQLIKSK